MREKKASRQGEVTSVQRSVGNIRVLFRRVLAWVPPEANARPRHSGQVYLGVIPGSTSRGMGKGALSDK